MKKYLKRQFLPPHYQEHLYEKYENFKQIGNSVSEFTNEFYHLQSYLDLNEPEAYIISRYVMGLRWAIRESYLLNPFITYLIWYHLLRVLNNKWKERKQRKGGHRLYSTQR